MMEHILREANSVADLLAAYGRKAGDPNLDNSKLYVFDAFLSFVKHALDRDAMGTTSSD